MKNEKNSFNIINLVKSVFKPKKTTKPKDEKTKYESHFTYRNE